MVAGILQPTRGTVAVNGRVSALLELGAGFNPEFSGRDNVYLNGSILGLTTRQIDQRYEDIEAFAEIGDFIDQPVKTYSSGMVVRLAFAVAINVDPEILLVDEALAVGDIYFRQRCMRKVHELRSRGITILFVSHAVSDVKAIGDRALWLDHGRMMEIGEPDRVIANYLAAMVEKDSTYLLPQGGTAGSRGRARPAVRAPEIVETIPNIDHRYGDGRAEILGIAVLDEQGAPLHLLEPAVAHRGAHQRARQRAMCPCPSSASCCATSWAWISPAPTPRAKAMQLAPMRPGDICTVDFHVDLPELYPASFSFSPAIADGTLAGYHDVRLDRQRPGPANEPRGKRDLRLSASALPRGSECAPAARTGARRTCWRNTLAEFTGERVIPGAGGCRPAQRAHGALHFRRAAGARQARAGRRLRRGLRLGRTGARRPSRWWASIVAAEAIDFARAHYQLPNLSFEQASCTALPHRRRQLRPGGGLRGDRAPGELARVPAGGAARAGAQRPVHRLHAQQALLHRVARPRGRQPFPRARIRFRGIPRAS